LANSCPAALKKNSDIRMMVLTAYPTSIVMDIKSPPVSPTVVAVIFSSQYMPVSGGSLLIASFSASLCAPLISSSLSQW